MHKKSPAKSAISTGLLYCIQMIEFARES